MKKSVIVQPPENCSEGIKIYVAREFMSLFERLQDDKFTVKQTQKQKLKPWMLDTPFQVIFLFQGALPSPLEHFTQPLGCIL